MQALKIELIQWVAPISFSDKIQTYFSRPVQVDSLGITPKILGNYDQKKNPFCTGFASAWCTTYNTGRIFTNEYIEEWCRWYIAPNGIASLFNIAERFAETHDLQIKKHVSIRDIKILLDNDYAIAISTRAPMKFWERWIKTGIAKGDFGNADIFQHAIYIRRDKRLGKTYIENSWYGLREKGFFNTIEIDLDDMLARKYIVQQGLIIYKK